MSAFGIEEEFILADRSTLLPASPTNQQKKALMALPSHNGRCTTEWLDCQIEYATPVLRTAAEALESLITFRKRLSSTAQELGLIATALGTAPQISTVPPVISDGLHHREMAELAPAIAAEQFINGMHVHVGVPDREAAVLALNGIRRWLPVLTALSANSPMWRGIDSGFASWRSIQYRRWIIYGTPPHFRNADDYESQVAALFRSEVVPDEAVVGWLVRLSPRHQTLEIRACDVQLHAEDALTLALLIRALVNVEIDSPVANIVPSELIDIAHWQAARFGLRGNLMDADAQRNVPAATATWTVFERAQPDLLRSGDEERVRAGIRRLLRFGTGAARQREVVAEGGIPALLEYSGHRLASRDA
ncbi:YbdK family carboxylate-amine ligase [Brevibacterium aurantiacum]|uniref:Putative glutamate--cysteine ligase 2 n=1 Tax=Brevibacterium aurantiacum TaxID=273384 RepID=A0A556C3N1_BREAU|nr:YbdK family carboxylate-amine ligase [Brevibacterium aurantiacum]TSI12063.1 YbdK family carboxylate-amine ligase [Brevibacterium aurantiacum]